MVSSIIRRDESFCVLSDESIHWILMICPIYHLTNITSDPQHNRV